MANKTLIYNYNIDNSFSQSVEAFDNIIVNNIFEDNFAVNDAQDFVYGILEEEADRYLTEAEKVEINQLITNSDYHYLIGGLDGIVQKIELKAVFEKIEGLINVDIFTDVTGYSDYNSNEAFISLVALGEEINKVQAMTAAEIEAMTAAEIEAMTKADIEAMTKADIEAMTKAEMEAMTKADMTLLPDIDTSNTTLIDNFIENFLMKITQLYGVDITRFVNITSYTALIGQADTDGDGELRNSEFRVLLKKIEEVFKEQGIDFNSFGFDNTELELRLATEAQIMTETEIKTDTSNAALSDNFIENFLIKITQLYGVDIARLVNITLYATLISQADADGDGELSSSEFSILINKIEELFKEQGIDFNSFGFNNTSGVIL